MIVYPFKASGTSFLCIRYAKPSTIAVLPIPGLPVNIALLSGVSSTSESCFISLSRPIAGFTTYSCSVKFTPYLFIKLFFLSGILYPPIIYIISIIDFNN